MKCPNCGYELDFALLCPQGVCKTDAKTRIPHYHNKVKREGGKWQEFLDKVSSKVAEYPAGYKFYAKDLLKDIEEDGKPLSQGINLVLGLMICKGLIERHNFSFVGDKDLDVEHGIVGRKGHLYIRCDSLKQECPHFISILGKSSARGYKDKEESDLPEEQKNRYCNLKKTEFVRIQRGDASIQDEISMVVDYVSKKGGMNDG